MGEPITVGGGGGQIGSLADYDIDLEFDETWYVNDGHDNFVYADHKIAVLKLLEYDDTLIADLTELLPADGECDILLKFNHNSERIYIRSKPLRISFKSNLWPTANGKRKRRTSHDRMEVDFGRGRWQGLEIATPSGGFKIYVESD